MTAKLNDTIRFRDTDGRLKNGTVCTLLPYGRHNPRNVYKVSCAMYQGLVEVTPEQVL